MIYVTAVALGQMIADAGETNSQLMEEEPDLFKYYRDLPRTFITLFQAMTGGVDWNDLMVPLETKVSPMLSVFFVAYISFSVLAMMNVVTGIFVDSALASSKRDQDALVAQRIHEIFSMADADDSGSITYEEFEAEIADTDSELMRIFEKANINSTDASGLFFLIDSSGSGNIHLQQLVECIVRLYSPPRSIDLLTLMFTCKKSFQNLTSASDLLMESLDYILTRLDRGQDQNVEAIKQKHQVIKSRQFVSWREMKENQMNKLDGLGDDFERMKRRASQMMPMKSRSTPPPLVNDGARAEEDNVVRRDDLSDDDQDDGDTLECDL